MDRNEIGLRRATAYLRSFRDAEPTVRARNGHELMRVHEAFDLRLFDELMTAAAMERDETRFSFLMGHHRTDRPHPADETWTGVALTVSYERENPVVRRTIPTPSWREARLADPGQRIGQADADPAGLTASDLPVAVARLSTPAISRTVRGA